MPAPTAEGRYAYRRAALEEAEAGLRPVQELAWEDDGLHLRLTGQGPWELAELVAIADSSSSPGRRERRQELHR